MRLLEAIEHGKYYHIFNRGINGEDLFLNNDNYTHFLQLYEKYIEEIADTFAWCLMKNHFHILVRIKEKNEIGFIPIRKNNHTIITPPSGLKTADGVSSKQYDPSHQFSHLFNAYAQSINKEYKRTGSLFESPFKRILVTSDNYFKELVSYIHNNPSHHGFCEKSIDYPWTSYHSVVSGKASKLKREELIHWFDSKENFISYHQQKQEYINIENFILE
jgi:putative transposase